MAKRIVIADDSATIQRAFAMTFGAEDVTLVAARSADEGFAMIRQLQPELVIADGMMPGRSGYDLCAQIKADPSLSSTAVYVLASAQQPYDESRGRQCGADGHFVKPFDTTAIIEKVHEALAKGPTEVAQPASTSAPLPDDFGPPMPRDERSGIPHGLSTSLAAASDDDEYGEISVDMSPPEPEPEDDATVAEVEYAAVPAAPPPAASRPSLTPPPYAASAGTPSPSFHASAPVGHASAPAGASISAASMRPSLIPGIRPGAVAPARPGAAPPRAATPSPAPAGRPPAPVARTLMVLPAANIPIPGTSRPAAPPMARPTPPPMSALGSTPAPLSALGSTPAANGPPSSSSAARPVPVAPPASTPAPLFAAVPVTPATPLPAVAAAPSVSAMVSAVVGAAVDQKIAAISARGPEYEAIAKLSREIIEQIVWEVVPELAEVIIREHVERHVRA
jgi:CheY-like chemotaxis protein